ncbi:MAG: YeeE/YedE thiosulfate transporter family protein [Acidobacteriota bacterium]
MELPLVLSTNMSHAAEMVVAVLVGIGFGFVLERAGFGRADNLASIFYGRDFRVMRVMFTAIVTAMIGLYFLDLAGIMPLGNIGILPTYVVPQLVGGALLGAGFIIGGYCPGTSIVAVASGKIDALFFVAGLFFGGLLFTMAYAPLAGFHGSTHLGRVLLHEYFGLPSGVMVAAVILFAVGALYAVTRIEAAVQRRLAARGENR